MLNYPQHVLSAVDSIGPDDPDSARTYLEAFRGIWGGYDGASLRRALRDGGEMDRLFAICALGAMRGADARADLLPLLEGSRPLERWASALELGEMRDQRALPVLWRMLTEFLPPDPTYRSSEYFRVWRPNIPSILGPWGRPESVPPLRAGLRAALRVELALDLADEASGSEVYYWSLYEDALAYALGRLGGFGALAGIEGADAPSNRYPGLGALGPTQTHLDQWRIDAVMGALHGQFTLVGTWTFAGVPGLLPKLTTLLGSVYGLDPEESAPALRRFEVEMAFYLSRAQEVERARHSTPRAP